MSTSEVQGNTSTQNCQELGATDTVQKSASHKGFVSGDGITGITYSAGTPASNVFTEAQATEWLKSLEAIDLDTITEDMINKLAGLTSDIAQELNDNKLIGQVNNLMKKSISDFDIRELMKLLIKAFSQLMNSQRQVTLNTITNIVTALKAKIADMEKSRDENYNAALASAIGSIVMGTLQVIGGAVSAASAAHTGHEIKTNFVGRGTEGALAGNPEFQKIIKTGELLDNIGKAVGYSGQLANGIAGIINAQYQSKAKDADIDSAIQDALMEVLRKMQDEGSNEFKQLIQFVSTLLQMLQELQRNASSTEQTIVRG